VGMMRQFIALARLQADAMGAHARGRFGVIHVPAFDISADMEARRHGSLGEI